MLSKFLYLHLPVINGQNVGLQWDILIDREKGSVKERQCAEDQEPPAAHLWKQHQTTRRADRIIFQC